MIDRIKIFVGYVLVGLFIYGFLSIKSCIDNRKKNNTEVQTAIEKQVSEYLLRSDTVEKVVHQNHFTTLPGKILKITDTVYLHFPSKIDTQAIVRNYYSRYTYSDSLKDSVLSAAVKFSVEQNKISKFDFKYKILSPCKQTVITNTVEVARHNFLFGLTAGASKNGIGFITPQFMYQSKRKRIYGIGYDIINNNYTGSFFVPITTIN